MKLFLSSQLLISTKILHIAFGRPRLYAAYCTFDNDALQHISLLRPSTLHEQPSCQFSEFLLHTHNISSSRGRSLESRSISVYTTGPSVLGPAISRFPSDSYIEFFYPFSSCPHLRRLSGEIQPPLMGLAQVLEDLDTLAADVAARHAWLGDKRLYTALVERVAWFGGNQMEADMRMAGQVTWVGRSSIEVTLEVRGKRQDDHQNIGSNDSMQSVSPSSPSTVGSRSNSSSFPLQRAGITDNELLEHVYTDKEGTWQLLGWSRFIMAARALGTGQTKSAEVPRLVPTCDHELRAFNMGEIRSRQRSERRAASHQHKAREASSHSEQKPGAADTQSPSLETLPKMPRPEDIESLHTALSGSKAPPETHIRGDAYSAQQHLSKVTGSRRNGIPMSATEIHTVVRTEYADRNTTGSLFGGHLLVTALTAGLTASERMLGHLRTLQDSVVQDPLLKTGHASESAATCTSDNSNILEHGVNPSIFGASSSSCHTNNKSTLHDNKGFISTNDTASMYDSSSGAEHAPNPLNPDTCSDPSQALNVRSLRAQNEHAPNLIAPDTRSDSSQALDMRRLCTQNEHAPDLVAPDSRSDPSQTLDKPLLCTHEDVHLVAAHDVAFMAPVPLGSLLHSSAKVTAVQYYTYASDDGTGTAQPYARASGDEVGTAQHCTRASGDGSSIPVCASSLKSCSPSSSGPDVQSRVGNTTGHVYSEGVIGSDQDLRHLSTHKHVHRTSDEGSRVSHDTTEIRSDRELRHPSTQEQVHMTSDVGSYISNASTEIRSDQDLRHPSTQEQVHRTSEEGSYISNDTNEVRSDQDLRHPSTLEQVHRTSDEGSYMSHDSFLNACKTSVLLAAHVRLAFSHPEHHSHHTLALNGWFIFRMNGKFSGDCPVIVPVTLAQAREAIQGAELLKQHLS